MLEDLAYRRLLDLYYLNERPFNGCSTDVARDIGMINQQSEVDYILSKFFPKCDDEWVNARAQKEIEAYKGKQKTASKAGKASAKARQVKASERKINDRSTTVQQDPNDRATKHKPLTINQEPLTNKDMSPSAQSAKRDKIPYAEIFDLYKSTVKVLAIPVKLNDKRKKSIKTLWNAKNHEGVRAYQNLKWWGDWFTWVDNNPFCTGDNERKWIADFDFCINIDKVEKAIEGKYNENN